MNTIYTFGYGNRPNYDVLQKYLAEYQIRYLIDVRLKPVGWSKIWHSVNLNSFCNSLGVKYVSEPSLGNISGKPVWIPPDTTLAACSILLVQEFLRQNSVVLMCAELSHKRCHRTDVANEIATLTGSPVVHLS